MAQKRAGNTEIGSVEGLSPFPHPVVGVIPGKDLLRSGYYIVSDD